MKRLFRLILGLIVLAAAGFGIYKFFFDCETRYADFGQYFVLNELDVGKIGEKVTVKLIDIEDDRCTSEDCVREGQYMVKLLVKDDRHIAYVTLGTLSETAKDLDEDKLDYNIELIETDGKTATFKVSEIEVKKK